MHKAGSEAGREAPHPNTWSAADTDSRDNGTPQAGRPASAAPAH
jgi:hypothetical protein